MPDTRANRPLVALSDAGRSAERPLDAAEAIIDAYRTLAAFHRQARSRIANAARGVVIFSRMLPDNAGGW